MNQTIRQHRGVKIADDRTRRIRQRWPNSIELAQPTEPFFDRRRHPRPQPNSVVEWSAWIIVVAFFGVVLVTAFLI